MRVFIVDDHPVVREGFSHLFQLVEGIEPVGTAGDGDEALALIGPARPDIVLLDMQLPGDDGAVVTRRIKESYPEARVIIFTAGVDRDQVARARAAGAEGILLKTTPVANLIRALHEVLDGRQVVDLDLTGVLQSPGDQDGPSPLSERELEVLSLLAEGMSNKELARALFISRATVKSHMENILRKLGVPDRAGAVAEGFRRGLVG
jgi:DNA-binding NarL/FixJ family response regulator